VKASHIITIPEPRALSANHPAFAQKTAKHIVDDEAVCLGAFRCGKAIRGDAIHTFCSSNHDRRGASFSRRTRRYLLASNRAWRTARCDEVVREAARSGITPYLRSTIPSNLGPTLEHSPRKSRIRNARSPRSSAAAAGAIEVFWSAKPEDSSSKTFISG